MTDLMPHRVRMSIDFFEWCHANGRSPNEPDWKVAEDFVDSLPGEWGHGAVEVQGRLYMGGMYHRLGSNQPPENQLP